MIVGGYAVAFHGHPRYTKDLDIYYDTSLENAEALKKTLHEFGFDEDELDTELFSKEGNIIVFGIEPSRIDLINLIDGIDFESAYKNRVVKKYDGLSIPIISLHDLIANKKASGRISDLADLEKLTKVNGN